MIAPGRDPEAYVLSDVKVDDRVYHSAIARFQAQEGFDSSMAAGNLLLLADRPLEAIESFHQAYHAAENDRHREAAVNGIARSLRAQYGGYGRSRAFLRAAGQDGFDKAYQALQGANGR
jgi:hypothetical protein